MLPNLETLAQLEKEFIVNGFNQKILVSQMLRLLLKLIMVKKLFYLELKQLKVNGKNMKIVCDSLATKLV